MEINHYLYPMKKLLAYILVIPYIIRANFLTAYRESLKQHKFIWRNKKPQFFKPLHMAVGDARVKALETGMRWYVIEPEPDKYVAVSEKYFQTHPQKTFFKTS